MRKIIICTLLVLCVAGLVGCGSKKDVKKEPDVLTEEEQKGETAFAKALREQAEQEEKDAKEEELNNTVLTIDTDEEFLKNMVTNLPVEEQESYFKTIVGRTVEFDGAIDYMDFVPEKKTRLTFALRHGDYNPNSITGPLFIIKDVGAPDDSVREAIQDGAKTGTNVKIKARIEGYDNDRQSVTIKPIKISIR